MIPSGIRSVLRGLKDMLPRGLLARSLLIIVMPVFLLQAGSLLIFFDRHWDLFTGRLVNAVAGETTLLAQWVEDGIPPERLQDLAGYVSTTLDMTMTYRADETLTDTGYSAADWIARLVGDKLNNRLQMYLNRPYRLSIGGHGYDVNLAVGLNRGVVHFEVSGRRLYSSGVHIFLLWNLALSLAVTVVAVLFMRNQIRPIRRLAVAADRFGKGRPVLRFRPEGAREVRQAGQAFLTMRNRIQQQIDQRTIMLAGISHDLRTPLTRLRLALSLLPDTKDRTAMIEDLDLMRKMLDSYLDFVRGSVDTDAEDIDLAVALESYVRARPDAQTIQVSAPTGAIVHLSSVSFKRVIDNILENARRYANTIAIRVERDDNHLDILIDDDGPGIPQASRDMALKPFARLDPERTVQDGHVGLGLTVAQDIMISIGGTLTLEDSPLQGLRVRLRFPV